MQSAPLLTAQAQGNSYKQTNLVSDRAGLAEVADGNLLSPRGICGLAGGSFAVASSRSMAGMAERFSGNGAVEGEFKVASPAGVSNPAAATGCVANLHGGFAVDGKSSLALFATEEGTISGWSGGSSSVLAVDHSGAGAVYQGLALVSTDRGDLLLAANFRSGQIEVFDSAFRQTSVPGNFSDVNPPEVPTGSGATGYAPLGVHAVTVGGAPMVLVTFALQNASKHDPVNVAGSGFVDLFDANGNFVRRVTADGHLNSPTGAAIAPAGFGGLAGRLLVGNFGDGTINAFDLNSGAFVDQMRDTHGAPIVNPSLADLMFAANPQKAGSATLYMTAGSRSGLFAALAESTPDAGTADFSVSASPASMTISAGQTAQFTVTVTSSNAFNSAVSLACSGAPAGSSCSFAASSVTPPANGMMSTTMTVGTNSNPYVVGMGMMHGSGGVWYVALIGAIASFFFCLFVLRGPRQERAWGRKTLQTALASLLIAIATAGVLFASGCGGYGGSSMTGTQRGSATVMITGTSGSLSHSTSVSLTVQ